MNNRTKVYAMYLPQYHEIYENSKFWGEGFTDWVGVRNTKPLYKGHRQPRIPLDKNYYDLSDVGAIKWQCKLARDAGIEGFAIYHYWFNERQNVLDTPPRLILQNKDIDISYFFSWDNTSWVRSWSKFKGNAWFPRGDKNNNNFKSEVLIKYELGYKPQWKQHFEWLLSFFKDDRYEKKGNKPVFMIFNPSKEIMEMCDYWNCLSKKNGFDGIHFIFRKDPLKVISNNVVKEEFVFEYEPQTSGWGGFLKRASSRLLKATKSIEKYDYDRLWRNILEYAKKDNNSKKYYCAFVDYDDSPRRGRKGRIIEGMTPYKFEKYFKLLYEYSNNQNKDYMFITAWNEWGEGAYLEPDEDNNYELLESVKRVLIQ